MCPKSKYLKRNFQNKKSSRTDVLRGVSNFFQFIEVELLYSRKLEVAGHTIIGGQIFIE